MVTAIKTNELIAKTESQLELIKNLHLMFDNTLDFSVEDMYLCQMTIYAVLIQQVKAVNPQWVTAKLNDALVELVTTKAAINKSDQSLTWEMVSRIVLLFGIAKALGWVEPQPEPLVYSCQICGCTGQLNKDIVERPYYDNVLHRDNVRFECQNIEQCLTRTGR